MSPRLAFSLSPCLLACLSAFALAQQPVKPVTLELPLAKPPAPAMKYHLLPAVREQTPGNAADHYRKASQILGQIKGNAVYSREELFETWLQMPLADLPKKDVRETLTTYDEVLKLIEAGAKCERCDFGLSDELRKAGINTVLEDQQRMRRASTVLLVRARLEMAEGDVDKALRTLQAGFALGRHVGEQPTLICALIGVAITTRAQVQLEALLQEQGCPNLYWALTDAPQPYISMRPAFQGERLIFLGTFPGLDQCSRDPEAPPWNEEQVQKAARLLATDLQLNKLPEAVGKARMGLLILGRHEEAKKALVAEGWSTEAVEKMPHMQVALLHALLDYDRKIDEVVKWQAVPYWQGREKMMELESAARGGVKLRPSAGPDAAPALPLADLLLPAVNRVGLARLRLDRRFQAERIVEAVRLHALVHDGKLPEKLTDITQVPVPLDPATGKPFEYKPSGDRFTLKGTQLPEIAAYQGNVIWYEVTLKKPGK